MLLRVGDGQAALTRDGGADGPTGQRGGTVCSLDKCCSQPRSSAERPAPVQHRPDQARPGQTRRRCPEIRDHRRQWHDSRPGESGRAERDGGSEGRGRVRLSPQPPPGSGCGSGPENKGLNTLCVLSAQSRTRLSDIALLRSLKQCSADRKYTH